MDDIFTLLNKIDTQLGTRYKSNYFIDDNKNNDMILNNRNSMYNSNINYSLNKPIDNFIIKDNNSINNNSYYYPNNNINLSQFDKISNGNKEYYDSSNLIYDQRNEMINSIEKGNQKNSDNVIEEMNASIIGMQNDLETLKKKNSNVDRINDDLDDINKKISKYQSNIKYLENEEKNTENALNSILADKKKEDESITNIHNELEGKFMDLKKKLNLIKNDQDKTGEQLRISMVDNNYDESISILNNNINKFMVESQLNSQDALKNFCDKIEEQDNAKKDKLMEINENIKNLEQEIDIINQNLNPLTDIPQMKENIQELDNQINNMTNKVEQISENTQIIKKADNDNNINMQDFGDKYNEILKEQLKEINFIKKNYTYKEDLNDINNKLFEIENDLKKLNVKDDGKDNDNKNIERENLINININKDSNMISKNEFNEEIMKKDNEYNNMKNNIDNKIKKIINNYQLLENQFNELNEQDANIQSSYNLILNKIDEQINENKNNISDLNNDNQNIIKIFGQIQRNFKTIESETEKIKSIEKTEIDNKTQIEDINNQIMKLENMLNENENKGSLNMLDSQIKARNDGAYENEENQNSNLLSKINELNERKNNNMEYLQNKLNEFRNEQMKINKENIEQIEQLNKKLNEENKGNELNSNSLIDIEEIDNDNDNDKDNMDKNNELEDKLNKFQEKITLLKTYLEKLYEVEDKNRKDAEEQFNQINIWINNFSSNINGKMDKLKNYVALNLKNLTQSLNDNDNDKSSN